MLDSSINHLLNRFDRQPYLSSERKKIIVQLDYKEVNSHSLKKARN